MSLRVCVCSYLCSYSLQPLLLRALRPLVDKADIVYFAKLVSDALHRLCNDAEAMTEQRESKSKSNHPS